jgi:uncharacterized membrane protein
MKVPVMFYVVVTTLLLVIVTVMVSMNLPFNLIFWITCLGQISVVVMVYKVLKDNYTTDKTFEDFYEDGPMRK